jgi:aldehyde dehydrogenase (NAD+)
MMVHSESEIAQNDLLHFQTLFKRLQENQYNVGNTTAAQRRAKLDKFHKILLKYRSAINDALNKDYKKHTAEILMSEIYPVTSEIKHAKRHLGAWMRDQSVQTPIALIGSSSYIKYEPKGVVLIISPWNFPINLAFCPMVSAIAAGNCIVLKPSEITPNTSSIIKKIVEETFDDNEVVVVEGGVDVSTALLKLPFNHIFFTGSPTVGKIVMGAAAKNLTSVTLELGGKSPTIVDETASIDLAAKRICQAKFTNIGQMCIAPDYVYVHKSVSDLFLERVKVHIGSFFSDHPEMDPSYGRVVNKHHFERLKSYLLDAQHNGATVVTGGQMDEKDEYMAPTILTNVDKSSLLMQNEIFGPILPVFTFDSIDHVISEIQAGEKPLALYIFSSNKQKAQYILNNTRAGGGCINHCAVYFYNNYLPFGGSNNSGIGKSHGLEGFKSFSNARGVLRQNMPNVLDMLVPPFNALKQKIMEFSVKYL